MAVKQFGESEGVLETLAKGLQECLLGGRRNKIKHQPAVGVEILKKERL